ncbi:MAG TPA: glycoside hydrolase family 43 protein [Opitutaceae bacterium]
MKLLRILIIAACHLGLMAFATVLAANPEKANLHLPEMPLHDPWILAHRASRTYYLYTSNVPRMSNVKGVGTMVYKSTDLRNWEPPKVVFLVPPTAFAQHGGWAPEVHEYQGRYYLFTTLHNEEKTFARPPEVPFPTYVRGTIVAVSDSPEGPFQMLDEKAPVPPADFMTLDGTLYLDENEKPWMVYAHEWLQKVDGTMEAVPLKPDLSAAAGAPIHLFKASDAPWLNAAMKPDPRALVYVTDGPEIFRTRDGHLLMLWSSYENGSYIQTVARSQSGRLVGPWEQLQPLVKGDSGHGMLFSTFEGQLMMVLHRPFKNARGKLYEMADRGDHLAVVKQRTDLDGDGAQLPPGTAR